MPSEPKRKEKTFGGANINHIRPKPAPDMPIPATMNIIISFEQALKLHLSIGQALAKLNAYNRAKTEGKRTAINLRLLPHKNRIHVVEDRLARGE